MTEKVPSYTTTKTADVPSSSTTIPVSISIEINTQNLALNTSTPITLHARVLQSVADLDIRLETSGVVLAQSPIQWSVQQPSITQPIILQTSVQINALGEGTIRAAVTALGPNGQRLYGAMETLYVLATDQGVFTGTASPDQVKRAYLAHARANGAISETEYQQALEDLQYGGAEVHITMVVPTPTP